MHDQPVIKIQIRHIVNNTVSNSEALFWSNKRQREFIMQRVDETSVSQNGATWTVQGFLTINI